MNLLIDTHVAVWYTHEPERLPEHILTLIKDIDNDISISMASAWELSIKASIHKIDLKMPVKEFVAKQLEL